MEFSMRLYAPELAIAIAVGCAPAPTVSPTPLTAATATPLYMPRNIAQAFRNGTRSPDGRPGPNYWQNRGHYEIAITALPPDRTVRGSEEITYYNNSPDTLRNPVIKLLVNIHKPGAPRMGGASADYLTEGVTIESFAINGQSVKWPGNARTFSWQRFPLTTPLNPHDSVHLSFKWHYPLSVESGREGMLDSTTYFLAYFYPRVAVFDDYDGWDTMNFTDMQEFYSDFNDYDVAVTVPANFVVWGTGTLLNAAEVLQPAALERFNRSLTSDQTINVAKLADMTAKRVTRQSRNTWRFRARDIPDVAFNLSDHYVWDAASVIVDSTTGRRASVQAAYNDTAADYRRMVQYGRHSLAWLSHNWPGVPYPFEKTTVVEGTADMEYPMLVNDEAFPDTVFSRFVVEHEIAHSWFPFYMGINETRYAYMDEGWATAFEYLIGVSDLGAERAGEFFKQFRVSGWAGNPSSLEDLPIITPTDALTGAAYGDNAYGKPALGYLALKDMLGDTQFRAALHGFMDRWHGKHPIPWDFFNSVNNITGQNLNWFWNAWFFNPGYIDLALLTVVKTGSGYDVHIANLGGMPVPVDVVAKFADGTSQTFHQTSGIWSRDLKHTIVPIATTKTIQSTMLDTGIWLDADSTNNTYPRK
jgi:hypothetical protein